MSESSGILYVATGEKYVQQALLSLASLKKVSPGVKSALYSDCTDPVIHAKFDYHFPITRKSDALLKTYDKILCLSKSPFDRTLFLDTDTYIIEDISGIFNLLDKHEIVLTFAHHLHHILQIYHKAGAVDPAVPDVFPVYQSGFILYKKTPAVLELFQDFIRIYEKKKFFYDQASFREAIWHFSKPLSMGTLPTEYNFNSTKNIKRWKHDNNAVATPKIFHYTMHKNENIEQIVKKSMGYLSFEQRKNLLKKRIKKLIKSILLIKS